MTDEIPHRLRRNAQNIAPFMEPYPCTCVECVDAAGDMPVGPTGDLDPWNMPEGRWFDPFTKTWFNPSDSPQETSQDWVPPWASKS